MKKRTWMAFGLSLLLILVFSATALAADTLTRFLGNDQDALIIGKVADSKRDGSFIVYPTHTFVSVNGIVPNYEAPKLKNKITVQGFTYSYDEKWQGWLIPKIGDKVVLSLDVVKDDTYEIAYGAYKLDDSVYKRALVMVPKGTPLTQLADLYAIQLFIQSDGQKVVSGFDEENILLHDGTSISYIKCADKLNMQTVTQEDMDYGKVNPQDERTWLDDIVEHYGFASLVLILAAVYLLGAWLAKRFNK